MDIITLLMAKSMAGGGSGGGGGGESITVDSSLSSSSKNPVQNKVIYSALQNKVDASSVSSSIVSGGTAPVNSAAVIAYINSLDATNTAY